jgi:hypothetical protein
MGKFVGDVDLRDHPAAHQRVPSPICKSLVHGTQVIDLDAGKIRLLRLAFGVKGLSDEGFMRLVQAGRVTQVRSNEELRS